MDSIEKLLDEHRLILSYLDLFERVVDKYRATKNDSILFEKTDFIIDFIKKYADEKHHAKEEKILFKFLEQPGVLTHCNPIGQMMAEHDMGRELVQKMRHALESKDAETLANNAQEFWELLRDHIYKEDNILFPMANQGLDEGMQADLNAKFQKVEAENNGAKMDEFYGSEIQKLESWIQGLI